MLSYHVCWEQRAFVGFLVYRSLSLSLTLSLSFSLTHTRRQHTHTLSLETGTKLICTSLISFLYQSHSLFPTSNKKIGKRTPFILPFENSITHSHTPMHPHSLTLTHIQAHTRSHALTLTHIQAHIHSHALSPILCLSTLVCSF